MQYHGPESAAAPIRAAQYVRMSTEHQQYSTENQAAVITQYASAHGMQVVRTYADSGKSGLTLQSRDALQMLLHNVEAGDADFAAILVYDVSRWGRFQDADESAYYEYLCKRAKVQVHYCAEPFVNDGSLSSTLLKTIKRTMAGEYSRELSVKCFAGKCRLIELGFRQGGSAGYGFRRLLQDQHGTPKGFLAHGERKSIFTDRVILVPGPAEEGKIINEIYRSFVEGGRSPGAIAATLNDRGILSDQDRRWTRSIIRDILTNPKYIGANVSNRLSNKLKAKRTRNPPERWVRRDDAFTPLVTVDLFRRAQEMFSARCRQYTDDELLELLRGLLKREGILSGPLIDGSRDLPSSFTYEDRFHGLVGAYKRIGYTPGDDYTYLETDKRLRAYRLDCLAALVNDLLSVGATVRRAPETNLLTINEEFTVSFMLARCRHTKNRGPRWLFRLDNSLKPDIAIAARMSPSNDFILDYYILPRLDGLAWPLDLAPANSVAIEVYRFDDLSFFRDLARRNKVKEKA